MQYSMHNWRKEMPKHWIDWLAAYLSKSKSEYLGCNDFIHSVKLTWDDGSNALFQYAFIATNKEHNELAVFTEHCGYFLFDMNGLQFELLSSTS